MSAPMVCPNGCDLTGPEIPEDRRHFYGDETHFCRVIGIEMRWVYDGIAYWACPDCGAKWHRFEGDGKFEAAIRAAVERDWDKR